MKSVTFKVFGKPKSAQQLRFNRKTGSTYRTKEYKERCNEIGMAAGKYVLDNDLVTPIFDAGALLALSVDFYFPYTAEHYRQVEGHKVLKQDLPIWYNKKVDIDNMLKSIKDSMNGMIYEDDGQIVKYEDLNKWYAKNGYVEITVGEVD